MRMNDQKGAAVVEFAVILPLLLVILFGIIEFGLIMYNKHIITNASREGARYGIVVQSVHAGESIPRRHNEAEIRTVVKQWIQNKLVTFGTDTLEDEDIVAGACKEKANDCTVVTNYNAGNLAAADFGDKLRVNISYNYDFLLLPNFVSKLAKIVEVGAETVMSYE